ncbi:Hypothetical predicted protein [Lecanosticta acicola]|uniref:Uncharacterized protein n=1 Tax=Lecanosticta acicola TaxID=111012 RepID=A0AAI8Z9A3_9PEZI|nr:Hypothetical predicted protein [Lecanosticta acicola]
MTAVTSIWSGFSLRARIAVAFITLLPLYYASFQFRYHGSAPSFMTNLRPLKEIPQQVFVETALQHQVSDPFDIDPLRELCQNRKPRNDIIISCAPGTGGVGNIRSYMLHCTRFAMEAGASMLLPHFHRRSKSDLFELFGDVADFEHFFDREHFVTTMQSACPHMQILDSPEEDWSNANTEIPHWGLALNVSTQLHPSPWRREFDAWFEENFAQVPKPVLLTSGDPGRDRAVMDDGMGVYYTIGRVLEFRPDARRLAMLCVEALSRRFHLAIDPTRNIYPHSYMGAHLRLDSDAVKAGWPVDFEQQTDWYINQTLTHDLRTIYAAGGTDSDLARFAAKAKNFQIDVVSKHELLLGNELKELKNLLWDQRGLVDFEVLLRGSQYGGYARSSFSHNIAFRRRYNSFMKDGGGGGEGARDPFLESVENHYQDELSVVYGRFDAAWEDEGVRTMWP